MRSRLLIATEITPRLQKDDPALNAQNLFFDHGPTCKGHGLGL